jgi:uncharacterized BrkB/YihY/UPF0761 family membrane protein
VQPGPAEPHHAGAVTTVHGDPAAPGLPAARSVAETTLFAGVSNRVELPAAGYAFFGTLFGRVRQAARPRAPRRVVTPAALVALAIGPAASALLSFYIVHLSSFGATCGPLGAAAGAMPWLFGNACMMLPDAALNAQIERHQAEIVA